MEIKANFVNLNEIGIFANLMKEFDSQLLKSDIKLINNGIWDVRDLLFWTKTQIPDLLYFVKVIENHKGLWTITLKNCDYCKYQIVPAFKMIFDYQQLDSDIQFQFIE